MSSLFKIGGYYAAENKPREIMSDLFSTFMVLYQAAKYKCFFYNRTCDCAHPYPSGSQVTKQGWAI